MIPSEQEDDWKLTYERIEPHSLCCKDCKAQRERVEYAEAAARDALEIAETILGACHVVEEGPDARWIDEGGDLYYEEDLRCQTDCPVCAALKGIRETLASLSDRKGIEG